MFIFEGLERFKTLRLRHIPVKLANFESQKAQDNMKAVTLLFRPDENNRVVPEGFKHKKLIQMLIKLAHVLQ